MLRFAAQHAVQHIHNKSLKWRQVEFEAETSRRRTVNKSDEFDGLVWPWPCVVTNSVTELYG